MAKKKEKKEPYLPGFRILFFLTLLLGIPAVVFQAWLDSVANHVIYYWPIFIVPLICAFLYCFFIENIVPGSKNAGYILVGGFFLVAAVLIVILPTHELMSQVESGMFMGLILGVAGGFGRKWLTGRKEWNAKYPDKPC
jgi:inner membrane protein involved in colicin E2 resistance